VIFFPFLIVDLIIQKNKARAHGGNEGKPKPGTDSISTGTKFVPVRKKKIPFIKDNESSIPTYPATRNS
jgi:hypothetical protein